MPISEYVRRSFAATIGANSTRKGCAIFLYMHLEIENFAGFSGLHCVPLESATVPNGGGKTTAVNAYIFALTGKVQTGFEPIPAGCVPVSGVPIGTVQMKVRRHRVRRDVMPTGTTLYVDGNVTTQSEFVRVMQGEGVDVEFAAACADVNVLTESGLTSDRLRKLLTLTGVIDDGETARLRRKLVSLRADRRTAEQYALSVVEVPLPTCEPLTQAEEEFLKRYDDATQTMNRGTLLTCPTCGRALPADRVRKIKFEYADACTVVTSGRAEAARILDKRTAYEEEQSRISRAQELAELCQKARNDIRIIDESIEAVERELLEADKASIRAVLPEGWEVITDKTAKTTGRTSNICTLTYKGVPLKSVNRAQRVKLCVELFDKARAARGMEDFPILVDNAESVQGIEQKNVVLFSVG